MGWSVLEGNQAGAQSSEGQPPLTPNLPEPFLHVHCISSVQTYQRCHGNQWVTMPSGHGASGVASRARHHIVNVLISGCCPAQRLAPGLKA